MSVCLNCISRVLNSFISLHINIWCFIFVFVFIDYWWLLFLSVFFLFLLHFVQINSDIPIVQVFNFGKIFSIIFKECAMFDIYLQNRQQKQRSFMRRKKVKRTKQEWNMEWNMHRICNKSKIFLFELTFGISHWIFQNYFFFVIHFIGRKCVFY